MGKLTKESENSVLTLKSFRFATNGFSRLLIFGAFRRTTSLHEVQLETTRFSLISGECKK
jgi:hypothetical protein